MGAGVIWIQLAIAGIVFVAGLAAGIKYESGEVYKLQAAQQTALVAAIEGARTQEQARFSTVQKAQNDAAKRNQASRASAVVARTTGDGLRDDNAAALRASRDSLAACNQYSATVSGLFDQCQGDFGAMAERAQGHSSDVTTLLDSWPR